MQVRHNLGLCIFGCFISFILSDDYLLDYLLYLRLPLVPSVFCNIGNVVRIDNVLVYSISYVLSGILFCGSKMFHWLRSQGGLHCLIHMTRTSLHAMCICSVIIDLSYE